MVTLSLVLASVRLIEPVDGMVGFIFEFVPWMIAVQFVIMMPFIVVSFVVVIVALSNIIWVVSIVSIDSIMIPA